MPIRSEASVQIERRIDEVFRLTNDHVPEWSIVVVAEEEIDAGPKGVGTKFRSITKDEGREMKFDGVVTEYDPPHCSAVSLKGQYFDVEAEYVFEDLQGTTRVTQLSTVHAKGLIRALFFVFGWKLKKASCDAAQRELESLREFCENHAGW